LFAGAGGVSEFVESFGVTISNDSSVFELGWRFVDESVLEGLDKVGEFLNEI
jgi:hypothetical protein